MKNHAKVIIALAIMVSMIPATGLALVSYSQDFEGLSQSDVDALGADGWLVYTNVFGPDWAYWYGYGAFPAPNDGLAFSQIVTGEGGGAQGAQQLVTFSDYNNADHAAGANLECNVFQEQMVGPGDVGETWTFHFQAKMGNLAGVSTAAAFIKTLDPNAGWATTNFVTVDMTAIPATWGDYSVTLQIDGTLDGQIFQFGFMNVATLYESSGIFYDNVSFANEGTVDTENKSWDSVKSLYR